MIQHLVLALAATASLVWSTTAAHAVRTNFGGQLFKLLADDGAAGDLLGSSVAIDDGVVAVGASRADDNGDNSGAAYLFDASTGIQLAKLLPSDGAAGDRFGNSIAIDNGIVAVGAEEDDDNGQNAGSAYVFDASTGAQIAKLLASDGEALDRFGDSIAIDNGVVAVGARLHDHRGLTHSGSVYLFDAFTGTQTAEIYPRDIALFDYFGSSVAIDNGILAVGTPADDDNGGDSGSAYLFDAATGAQLAKLRPTDGAAEERFGDSISIHNGIVAVGAPWDDDNGEFSGSAYVFDASTGTQIHKLLPSDGAEDDRFGDVIGIDNGVVAVGVALDDANGLHAGSAYLFNASTGAQIDKLLLSDGAPEDHFGVAIAIDNGVVAVGAYGDDDNGDASGSAYLFADSAAGIPAVLTSCSFTFGTTDNPPCDVANLVDDDDVDQIHRSQFGFSAFEPNLAEIVIVGNGANASRMTSIETRDGSDATNLIAKVKARNYVTNLIDDVGQYNVSFPSDDDGHTTPVNSSEYIDTNGDIEVRLRYVAPATFLPQGFTVGLDQVRVMVE